MTRNDLGALYVGALCLLLTGCPKLTEPDPAQIYDGLAEPVQTALPDTVERTLSEPVAGWQWMDLPETVCRDDSSSGVAIQAPTSGVDADKLVIFLRGGNACLNTSCAELINPSHFDESDWDALLCTQLDDCTVDNATSDPMAKWNHTDDQWFGVLDGHPDNPFAGWTKVYVPYCSGDWHGGENPEPFAIGSGESVFMGAANTRVVLAALRDELGTDFDKVLFTGASAGGVGTLLNHHQAADLYGAERTYLLSDAGPMYTDEYVAECMQARLKDLWRLDRNLPVSDTCPGDTCPWNDDAWMDARWTWLLDSYSRGPVTGPELLGSRMALVISGRDSVSADVFDMMENECARIDDVYLPLYPPYSTVEQATHALRTDVFDAYHGMKIFHVQDTEEHMWMWGRRKPWWTLTFEANGTFEADGTFVEADGTFEADGTPVSLAEWVDAMLHESPTWDHAIVREIEGQ
ncbi:MAG: hypothetical protein GY937_26680 [bacterium]|nr:hypothetical protein [bacterium]